ncbi:MarR family transcriptional regulator [Sphingomonas sp. PB4P5]|uniref:MarR family transcriptional regulator n=1 Tax=Parasphingomonas puruogangriensis TaxID=3096155 RepID=UPI002FCC2997
MESVEDLIKDLSTKLGDIAGEFSSRADRIIASGRAVGDANGTDPLTPVNLVARARQQLAVRKARRRYFPADLFHEPAWEMLVALFIIYQTDHSMNVKALVSCSDAPATTSQRWIDHLHKSGLIDRVTDTVDRRRIDISLSDRGYDAMARYLSELADES